VLRDAETSRDGDRIREPVAILDWFRAVWEVAEVMPRLAALEALFSQPTEARNGIEDEQHVLRSVPFGMVTDNTE
jgi:hypothetical protein